jgi:hypothetical protein
MKSLQYKTKYLMVDTKSVIHAGHRVALVDLEGAILSGKSGLAGADEVVDRVVTFSAVFARVDHAVVHVRFAVGSNKT